MIRTLHFSFWVLTCFSAGAQIPVVVKEEFNTNAYGWYETNDVAKGLHMNVKDGKYVFNVPDGGWLSWVFPYVKKDKDHLIQADFIQTDGETNQGIGLMWGYGDSKYNYFVFTNSGYFLIRDSEVSKEWVKTALVKPLTQTNTLKIEQKSNVLRFYLNGEKVQETASMPWYGDGIGFCSFARMNFTVDNFVLANDFKLSLPKNITTDSKKENVGPMINTKYDDLAPIIAADGNTLYFNREGDPENTGGAGDGGEIWFSVSENKQWKKSRSMGVPVNTNVADNLISVSTDNNTLLFHVNGGFSARHRLAKGWSELESFGISFVNENPYLEGCLSSDKKAILFTAMLKKNLFYSSTKNERDIYVCLKQKDGTWSAPLNLGKDINTESDEYSPFLASDGRTLYFATTGWPGYGGVDIFMSKRLGESWDKWTAPVNLGPGVNTAWFDAYYTLPASGEYAYMVTNLSGFGKSDIVRLKIPEVIKPDPVVFISGKVLNAKTKQPLQADIKFENLASGLESGEAISNPATGEYNISLPYGANYGVRAQANGYFSINENLSLDTAAGFRTLSKDLFLVPIEIGETILLNNVFFEQSKAVLKPESYPELDRLVQIMKEQPTLWIEIAGHTDNRGNPSSLELLSKLRGDAVQNYLIKNGISKNRMTGKGYGGTKPIASNNTEDTRKLNRRVEFKITKR